MDCSVSTPQRLFKIILAGDSSVGKTAILHRFCDGHFRTDTTATVGESESIFIIVLQATVVVWSKWWWRWKGKMQKVVQFSVPWNDIRLFNLYFTTLTCKPVCSIINMYICRDDWVCFQWPWLGVSRIHDPIDFMPKEVLQASSGQPPLPFSVTQLILSL